MTDERGGRYFREARFFLAGDKVVAQSHILEARSLMGYMRDMRALGGPAIQVKYAALQDGTQIKATMMNGQYRAEIVSPLHVDKKEGLLRRGFILVLSGIDVSEAAKAAWESAWDSAMLFGVEGGVLAVQEWGYPVTDAPPRHLEYFVASTKTPSEAKSTDAFGDVFTRLGSTVFRNASPLFDILPDSSGIPFVHAADLGDVLYLFDVTDSGVRVYRTSTGAEQGAGYTWAAFYQPLAPGRSYSAGAALDANGNTVGYVGTNVTTPGATQVWSALVTLDTTAPWVSAAESFTQIDATGDLADYSGWTSTSTSLPGSPISATVSDPIAMYGWTGGGNNWYKTLDIPSGEVVPQGSSSSQNYNKTLTSAAEATLADGKVIATTRGVTIGHETRAISAHWMASWPYDSPLYLGVTPDGSVIYWHRDTSIDGGWKYKNERVGGAMTYERIDSIDHTDTSFARCEVTGLPYPLRDTQITHVQTVRVGEVHDYAAAPTEEPGPISLGGDDPSAWTRVGEAARAVTAVRTIDTASRTNSVSAVARDYLYADFAEDVFIWVESVVISSASDESAGAGSHTVTTDVVAAIRGIEHRTSLHSYEALAAASIPAVVPTDVVFGPAGQWSYVSPQQPKPVFAPRWMTQGLCKHIAYTTLEEEARGVAPVFALSMRIQCLYERRYPLEVNPDPPIPPAGTEVFVLPNIERMFEEHVQTRLIFLGAEVTPGQPWEGGIEQKCAHIDFAIPGESRAWIEDLGAPVSSIGTDTLVGDGSFADPARSYYPDRHNGQIYRT